MAGALLDSHALYWMVSKERPLRSEALVAIGTSQQSRSLFVSPISFWELSIASQKRADGPDLGPALPGPWLRRAIAASRARLIPIGSRIAAEAALVPLRTGHKDPGDCFLIATARIRQLSIITRDSVMLSLAEDGYIDVVAC